MERIWKLIDRFIYGHARRTVPMPEAPRPSNGDIVVATDRILGVAVAKVMDQRICRRFSADCVTSGDGTFGIDLYCDGIDLGPNEATACANLVEVLESLTDHVRRRGGW